MRDSILNVRSSGLGGVVHEIKRGARKIDKVKATKVKKFYENKEKKYRRNMNINLSGKNEVKHGKILEKDFKNRESALSKIHTGKGYSITREGKPISQKNIFGKVSVKPKYNKWGDRIA